MRYCIIILKTKRDKKSQRARNNRPYREKVGEHSRRNPAGRRGNIPPVSQDTVSGMFYFEKYPLSKICLLINIIDLYIYDLFTYRSLQDFMSA